MNQTIEAIIYTEDIDTFRAYITNDLGINNIEFIGQAAPFICKMQSDNPIEDSVYAKISKDQRIGVISDSESLERGSKIFKYIHGIESLLGKILLLAVDSDTTIYKLIYKFGRNYVSKGQLAAEGEKIDAITSSLSIRNIRDIVSVDLALQKRDEINLVEELSELLKESKSFNDFKRKFNQKTVPKILWDELSKTILKQSMELDALTQNLSYLAKIRDKYAHHKVITAKEFNNAESCSQAILTQVILKDNPTLSSMISLRQDIHQLANEIDTYPQTWREATKDSLVDSWGMYNRESVSYAAHKVAESGRYMPYWGGRGNAKQWPGNARAAGIPVDGSPRVGDVAITSSGPYGHAMYVESVSGGSVTVSQYNFGNNGEYSTMTIPAAGLEFIHF